MSEHEEETKITPDEMEDMVAEEELVQKILNEKKYYFDTSQGKRKIWTECWKLYNSVIDATRNPFLANLFIPKVHEAVELLAAFLTGTTQTISAEGEGIGDAQKARMAEKFLDWQWRKPLKARDKVITCAKQMILFGDGVMKVGEDTEKGQPFMEPVSLPDIYMDYYAKDIQDSYSVIHRIVKNVDDVKDDDRYNEKRHSIVGADVIIENTDTTFDSADNTVTVVSSAVKKVELLERWTDDEVITICGSGTSYCVIRREPNEYESKPFVKFRFKSNPLPNRAYDIGAIEPTRKIQQAFNDAMNEMFDNTSLINNKHMIAEKDAGLLPMDLQRRPGGITRVNPGKINSVKWEEMSDIKPSMLELLNRLDNEFQQASMVVNLLKGVPGAEFATEAALGQQNVMTLMDPIEGNIEEGLAELGQMLWKINQKIYGKSKKKQVIKLFENDKYAEFLEFTFKEIDGMYDLKIVPDRDTKQNHLVVMKRLLDFLAVVSKDQNILMKYPTLPEKLYKRWLEESGEGDPSQFFEEQDRGQMPQGEVQFGGGAPAPTPRTEENTMDAMLQAAVSPAIQMAR